MTNPIEDRLREAYQAKTAQLTERRLDQLAERRERAMDDLLDAGHTGDLPILGFEEVPASPRQRWIAPGLAAAAVVALAVGATALVANHLDSQPRPNPPATRVTSPTPSSSPSASPSASASAPASSTAIAGPGYLPRGRTGSRGEVPWATVGTRWRLVLPYNGAGTSPASLYLYDPAGGRYLISDRLPAGATLVAWSPDGTRAMVYGYDGGDGTRNYQQVDLRSGRLTTAFRGLGEFVSYTQPKGLAILVAETANGTRRFVRYSLGGQLEHTYATDLPGHGELDFGSVFYLPDGAQFVSTLVRGPLVLMSNDGHLVRTYELPSGFDFCSPLKWWTETSVLERCSRQSGFDGLYLQPTSGGAPTLLTTTTGRYRMGYRNAWAISNGHTLLENSAGCGNGGYDILLGDGTTRPLRGPAGMPATNTPIINVDGDLVTFQQKDLQGCGGEVPHYQLIDYDLVTGATSKLLDGAATMASWPGDQLP